MSVAVGVAAGGGLGGGAVADVGGTAAVQGGKLTVLATDDVDSIDPGMTSSSFGLMVAYATHRPLFSHGPGNAEEALPDLAEGPPVITDDGSTVTVKIKSGVRFSPPINRSVTSKDVKYAIERAFFKTVANAYAGAYFGAIAGAKTAVKAGTEIEGITTPDDQTLVIRLSKPTGGVIAGASVLPLTAPVPEEYASKFDKKDPSTYDRHAVATGPYMIENNASGRAVGHRPTREIRLVRNPNWDPVLDYKPAFLDEIEIRERRGDIAAASLEILRGRSMVNGDFAPAPATLREALERYNDQVVLMPAGGGRYVAMNTTIKPFDDLNVRRAVVAGFDRNALRLTRGGEMIGDIPTHIMPPNVPGHEEAGGLSGPGLDFLAKPAGDSALSAEYFKKAGFASGKYEGKEVLLMVGTAGGVAQRAAEIAQDNFERLGFKVSMRLVSQDVMYTEFCGRPAAQVAICPNVGRFKDFSDGLTILDPTFNGNNIFPENNSNWSQLNDPFINTQMERAAQLIGPRERALAWGEIDRLVSAQAPVIPWLWDKTPLIRSHNVRGIGDEFIAHWSLTFTSLTDPDR